MAWLMMMMPLNNEEEESGNAFDIHSGTAMEAYESGSSDDSGPYWNTFKCAPYYQPID